MRLAFFIIMTCAACGPVLTGAIGGEGPKEVTIDNGTELEPEEALTVKPLKEGPVLPRLKRPNKKEEQIEKRISDLGEAKKYDEMLPLFQKLRVRTVSYTHLTLPTICSV